MYHLVRNVDDGGGYACVGAGDIWDIAVPSPQFFCESKIVLKIIKNKTKKQTNVCSFGYIKESKDLVAVLALLASSYPTSQSHFITLELSLHTYRVMCLKNSMSKFSHLS